MIIDMGAQKQDHERPPNKYRSWSN